MTTNTFTYDPSELPEVTETDRYSAGSSEFTIFRAGDWTFELPDDGNREEARTAALAWISWYNYLEASAKE